MIRVSKPLIGKEEVKAVLDVLKSGILAQGPKVDEVEKKFAILCKTKYAVALNSGTAALHTALYAIGIKPGDEVITTPFTFVATANSILMVGAKPIFADIDSKTYNIDPQKIENTITKKTKAIIAVNLYGQPADYAEIKKIAKKHNLIVIEDAAQSVGAKYKNKISGNLGDIGCFSFYATKNIMSGEGGMITTNNKLYFERARLFRHHGQSKNKAYHYSDLGFNYRMTDIQAVILLEQLKKLSWIIKKRQQIAKKYTNALSKLEKIVTPYEKLDRSHVYHQYTLRILDGAKVRNKLQNLFKKNSIGWGIYYPKGLHKFKHFDYNRRLPETEIATDEVISIPVHPLLTKNEVDQIIKVILKL